MARKNAARVKQHRPHQPTETAASPMPADRWINFLTTATDSRVTLAATLLVAFLVRWAVSLGPYSGEATPPVFGDYEAQRHWMEITLHLPPSRWYFYDLSYWGLDYPPLSAYVSWVCGFVGSLIDPSWFALDKSRGIETSESRVFMRLTVLACEALVYIPAVWWFVRTQMRDASKQRKQSVFFVLLLQPSLIVIDHGHFQYNSVMLGLTLLAAVSFMRGRDILGAAFFCLSLMFKQMALYYAPAVFAYLLGRCFRQPHGLVLFIQLGVTVFVVFGLHLLPFAGSLETLKQVFIRIFPVARGLYEDKVANVWCALSIVIKLRDWYSKERLMLLSFQVHEKTILVPLLPITLLYLENPTLVVWFTNVAMFSMYPLLRREGATLQFMAMAALWNMLCGIPKAKQLPLLVYRGILATYATMASILVLDHFGPLPARLPHLYVVLNVVFSAGCFSLTLLYLTYSQVMRGGRRNVNGHAKRD
ncbi:glycosyl transferase [Thamnocephalis sphaerospora]|uniref:Alpha-1,3-glucosyltransferase n=1 Tax=Thamnocephalis sphaerospora TaxID=78915 RepID=A0A4P9XMG6_9FUNG|nr:glycosyl transferase [Thamnocephalis sphaerospora]|eukprot:RKP06450.1 glycosyl transferase [Thamnocephalis sphaerospora]